MACGRTTQSLGLRLSLARRSTIAAAVAFYFLALAAPAVAAPSAPAPVKATLTVTTSDGYARLVFTASEYIDGTARQSGNVLIISFKQPLDVAVNRVAEQAADYIGAARRDPDGKGVRIALAQSVTVHAMAAGEKFFIDLLPATWSGLPPGLPQDVVDELARRAREAETLLEHQRNAVQAKKLAPIRVHVASQPTFTRYLFAVPSQTAVSADRVKSKLVLNFGAPVTFDLADAQAALPKAVQEIIERIGQRYRAGPFHPRRQCRHPHLPRRVGFRRRRGQCADRCGRVRRAGHGAGDATAGARCGGAGRCSQSRNKSGPQPCRRSSEYFGRGRRPRSGAARQCTVAATGNDSAGCSTAEVGGAATRGRRSAARDTNRKAEPRANRAAAGNRRSAAARANARANGNGSCATLGGAARRAWRSAAAAVARHRQKRRAGATAATSRRGRRAPPKMQRRYRQRQNRRRPPPFLRRLPRPTRPAKPRRRPPPRRTQAMPPAKSRPSLASSSRAAI